MDLQQIKDNVRKELEKALAEKEEIIKQLQQKLDGIERFKIGNIVIGGSDNYFIVGEPEIIGEFLVLPIRHHVYPRYVKSVSMNFSGVIDNLRIPLHMIDKAKVVSMKEFFEIHKNYLKKLVDNDYNNIKQQIKRYEDDIEDIKKKIELFKKREKEYDNLDFENTYDSYVDNYINSEYIKDYIYSVKPEDYVDKGQYNIDYTMPKNI